MFRTMAFMLPLALVAIASACGGDDGDEAKPTSPPAVTRTAAATSTRAVVRTPAATGTAVAPTSPAAPAATNTQPPVVPTNTPPPGPPPVGPVTLTLTAKSIQFMPVQFTVTAGSPVTIALTNDDEGIPHNVHVFGGAGPGVSLGMTAIAQGASSQVLELGVLDAGPYFFRCDVHPAQMSGTITAQ